MGRNEPVAGPELAANSDSAGSGVQPRTPQQRDLPQRAACRRAGNDDASPGRQGRRERAVLPVAVLARRTAAGRLLALVAALALATPALAQNNSAPGFSGPTSFSVPENETAVGQVVATDPDSEDSVAYVLTGGADQARFEIDAMTGVLSFRSAPDHENPGDAASTNPLNAAENNEYIVTVTATGGTGSRALTAERTLTVTVTGVNERPVATSARVTSEITVLLPYGSPVTWASTDPLFTDPENNAEQVLGFALRVGVGGSLLLGYSSGAEALLEVDPIPPSGSIADGFTISPTAGVTPERFVAVYGAVLSAQTTAVVIASDGDHTVTGNQGPTLYVTFDASAYFGGGARYEEDQRWTLDSAVEVYEGGSGKVVGAVVGWTAPTAGRRSWQTGTPPSSVLTPVVGCRDADTGGSVVAQSTGWPAAGAADSSHFSPVAGTTTSGAGSVALGFAQALDFESPADTDTDNVYRVRLYNNHDLHGIGGESPGLGCTGSGIDLRIQVRDAGPPSAPRMVKAVFDAMIPPRLVVTWEAPAGFVDPATNAVVTDEDGPPVIDYDYRYREQGTAMWTEVTNTEITAATASIAGLGTDTNHEVQVRAESTEGEGEWSAMATRLAPGVTVSPTSLAVTEGTATGTSYTVVLTSEPTATATVTVGGAGDELEVTPPSLTFTSSTWDTAQTVAVSAEDDAVAEGEEEVTLTHAVSGYGAVTSAAGVTVTITDNDMAGVTVRPTSLAVTEGTATGTSYTVVLTSEPTATVTVTVGGAGDELEVTPPSLTFTSSTWDTAQTVAVSAQDDAVAEGEEEVTLTHAVSGYGAVTSAAGVTVTITDNDMAGVTVRPTSLAVTEGAATGTSYTVVLTSEPTATVTVTVGGAGDQLEVTPPSLTFTSSTWDTAQTVAVRAEDDAVAEGEEEVTLTHAVSGYGAVTSAAGVTVTITDNDVAGVTVRPTSLAVTEGAATGTSYTVALTSEPTATVTVTVGGAGDQLEVTPPSLTFTSSTWDTAQTVAVRAEDDAVAEGEEEVTLTHAVSGYGTVTSAAGVTVTITDNDMAGVTVSPTSVLVSEDGSDGTYTVVLTSEPTATVTVTVGGAGDQLEVTPPSLTFTSSTWDTAQTVAVSAEDDAVAEGQEEVTLTHTVSGYASVTSADGVTVTIADNDMAGVTVGPTSVTVTEGAASGADYEVVLNTQPTATVTVTVGGAGDQLEVTPPSLTFTSSTWDTAQTVTVSAQDDAVAEGEEEVTLTHAVGGYGTVTSAAGVTVTITDNDRAGVTVSPASLAVTEGTATGTSYTVVLTSEPTATVTVTVGGAGDQLEVTPASLTFTSSTWDTVQTVAVRAQDDAVAEGEEEVTLTHAVSGYGTVTSADGVTVIITDNDMAGVTVSPMSLAVTEGAATGASYTVALTSEPTATVTVTVGGAGDQLEVTPPSLTFTSSTWDTAQTVTVRAQDDAVAEGEEEVTLTHAVSGYGTVTSAAGVTVTITDNDMAGVTVSPTSLAVTEGAATGTSYTVALTSEPTATVTVTVGGAGDQLEVTPASLTFTSSTWDTAQTVAVSAEDDAVAEGEEEVTLTHAVNGYPLVTSAAGVTVTITDNDMAGVTVSPTSLGVAEGAPSGADYEVVLISEPTQTVTVTVGGAGDQLEVIPPSLTFTSSTWDTAQTVTVRAKDDAVAESEEEVTLTHTVSGYPLVTSAAGVTVTIEDDDTTATPKAWLARFGRTVSEHVLDAVAGRLSGPRGAGTELRVGGQSIPMSGDAEDRESVMVEVDRQARVAALAEWMEGGDGDPDDPEAGRLTRTRTWTDRELFTGTSFAVTAGTAHGGHMAAWGRGAVSRFEGRDGDVVQIGEVLTGMIGADLASGRWRTGLVASRSRGKGDYRSPRGAGEVSATLTALHPWAGLAVSERLSVWAAAGYGEGRLELTPEARGPMETDIEYRKGAAGAVGELLAPGRKDGARLALRTDARITRTTSEAVTADARPESAADGGVLSAAQADVWMLRLGVEGSRRFALGERRTGLTPSFEFGLRRDGGDAETGFGVDIGAGLAVSDPRRGLSAELAGRGLLAHEASGFREWGASAALGWDPAPSSALGPSASLRHTRGASSTGGMDALLARRTMAGLVPNDDARPGGTVEAELGYGFPVLGGRAVGTPHVGLVLRESGETLRLGYRYQAGRALVLGFEASRREPAADGNPPEHGLVVRASVRW